MRPDRQVPGTLWLIVAVALGLRLLGGWCASLTFDELAHVALAETIDLRPAHLHLVPRTVSHPLLGVYVIKLSGLVFGTGDLGLRMLHVLAGTATVLPVYFLGKRAFSERAGLWAAALLAVDQFHAGWSRVVISEVLMLFFAALVLLQFLRVLQRDTAGRCLLLGALLGLAYLSKELAILLLPVLWGYLLLTPVHRRLLRRAQWYLAHAVFLTLIAPDVFWNLARPAESYWYRDLVYLSAPVQISLKSLSLYVGELFRAWLGADVLDVEYEQGNLYACYWPAGLLYLAAVPAALPRRREAPVRLLLLTFLLVFAVFIFLPGGGRFEPFWWASMSLIPAVVCAGWVLDRASRRGKPCTTAAFVLIGLLGIHYLPLARRVGTPRPRATVEQFAADFIRRAHDDLRRGDLRSAEGRFVFVLNIAGADAEAYYGLGLVALRRGRIERARRMLSRCLEVDPGHRQAQQQLERIMEPCTGKDRRATGGSPMCPGIPRGAASHRRRAPMAGSSRRGARFPDSSGILDGKAAG